MLAFTWNLNRNHNALTLALAHLEQAAKADTVLACFQELPKPLPSNLDASALKGRGLDAAAPPLAEHRAVFVHSASLALVSSNCVAADRMQMARFRLPTTGTEFHVAGIHALDRRNTSVEAIRGGVAALTRRDLDDAWSGAPRLPLVALGDFNAWPDLPELEDRACFFGVTSAYRVEGKAMFFGRSHPPLFRLEPPSKDSGTTFHSPRWRHIDHI